MEQLIRPFSVQPGIPQVSQASAQSAQQSHAPSVSSYNPEAFQRFMQQKQINEQTPDEFCGIKEFPFETFSLHKFSLILGSRDCGKSNLLIYMLYRMQKRIPTCVFFCSSEGSEPILEGILPDCFTYEGIDDECLKRIRQRHVDIMATYKETGRMPPGCTTTDLLILGDDILHDKKSLARTQFRQAILSGRHDNEGMWLLIQYAQAFPKELRKQVDYLFLQEFKTEDELKYIHKEFASAVIQKYEDFVQIMDKYTGHGTYGTLVLKLKGGEPNLWYIRAPKRDFLPPFRLDAGTMFQMAAKHEKPVEQKGNVLDYNSPTIFDCRRLGQQRKTLSLDTGKKRGGGITTTFRMPS